MADYSVLTVLVAVTGELLRPEARKELMTEAVRLANHLKTPVGFYYPPLQAPFKVHPREDVIDAQTRLLNLLYDVEVLGKKE